DAKFFLHMRNNIDVKQALCELADATELFCLQCQGAKVSFPQIIKQDSGDGTENERQGSKTSTRQWGHFPSGPVADVGRDLLMRCMKMRVFFEERFYLLFKGQRFNTVKRDFCSLALLQDWLDTEMCTLLICRVSRANLSLSSAVLGC
ncbi:MAG: hypothetical protein EZS28_045341, partial [Streblomastix strix]